MGRDQMKSATRHSFHEPHADAAAPPIPFETLVREMLAQLGEDPAREGLRAVPPSIREAALAVGATPWQAVRFQVLVPALPTMLTGVILALSRAIGETAPLIMIGALTFVAFDPTSPRSPFTVLPIQIYNWISRPQAAFATTAAAGIIVLLVVLLTMNAIAIVLRNYFEGKRRW